MPSATEIRILALNEGGNHDALHTSSIARFFLTRFPQYFNQNVQNYIKEEAFEELYKKFEKNTISNPLIQAIQAHLSAIHHAEADDLSFARNIVNYINLRFAEGLDEWDKALYYEYQQEPKGIRSVILPLKRVFYCIFLLLQDSFFLNPQYSEEEKTQEANKRV